MNPIPAPASRRTCAITNGQVRREADEFMELHTLRWSEVMASVRAGEIEDGKTIVALLFVHAFLGNR